MEPEFFNRENECVKTEDGRTIWLSRSCAVAITTIWSWDKRIENPQVLLVKRAENVDNEPGRWCLPCGYLDYNETLYEAAIRELYEETGVYLPLISPHPATGDKQPWMIHSGTDDSLSNVTSHFGFVMTEGLIKPEFKVHEKEIEQADLIFVYKLDEYDIAFNHRERIYQFLDLARNNGVGFEFWGNK